MAFGTFRGIDGAFDRVRTLLEERILTEECQMGIL